MDERFYWLSFSVFPGIGPIKFQSLIKNFGTAKNAWSASSSDLKNVIGEKLVFDFEKFKKKFSVENYLERLRKKDVSFLILTDEEYPKLLKEIPNPPFLLYFRGEALRSSRQFEDSIARGPAPPAFLPASAPSGLILPSQGSNEVRAVGSPSSRVTPRFLKEDRLAPFASGSSVVQRIDQLSSAPAIAVVGTRKITQYGKDVTQSLTEELVAAGFTIVSGLAFGVDSVAHQTTIESGGKTIAVLGCGVDCCTPPSNQKLYDDIVENGCVISEFPLSQIPTRGSFPSRNRIIAGLSMGVLVTEGAEDSGALITADYALKFNRKVFAVPGPITSSLSKGPHKLISAGAKFVTNAEDILKELKSQISNLKFQINPNSKIQKFKTGDKNEQRILKMLENESLHFNQIVQRLKMDSAKMGSILSMMEIKGLVKSVEGGYFSIT